MTRFGTCRGASAVAVLAVAICALTLTPGRAAATPDDEDWPPVMVGTEPLDMDIVADLPPDGWLPTEDAESEVALLDELEIMVGSALEPEPGDESPELPFDEAK